MADTDFSPIEERLQTIQDKYNVDRGHAVLALKLAYDEGNENVRKFPGVEDFLAQETGSLTHPSGYLAPTERMLGTAAKGLTGRLLGHLVDYATTGSIAPPEGMTSYLESLQPERKYPGQLHLPAFVSERTPSIIGGGRDFPDVAGEVLGIAPAFRALELGIEPLAAGSVLAARLLAKPATRAILSRVGAAPATSVAQAIEANMPILGSRITSALTTGLTRGASGGIVGAADAPPGERLQGAGVGIGMGLTLPFLLHDIPASLWRGVMGRPISGYRSHPEIQRTAEFLGKLRSQSAEKIFDEWAAAKKTIADVQAEAAAKGAPPIDILKIATPEELEQAFGTTAFLGKGPKMSTNWVREADIMEPPHPERPIEGLRPPRPLTPPSTQRYGRFGAQRPLPRVEEGGPFVSSPGPAGVPENVPSPGEPLPTTQDYEEALLGWPTGGEEIPPPTTFAGTREGPLMAGPYPYNWEAEVEKRMRDASSSAEADRKSFRSELAKALKNEKGAIMFGRNPIDLDAVAKENGIQDLYTIPIAVDLAPDATFGKPFMAEISTGTGLVPTWVRLPHEVFARDPITKEFWTMSNRAKMRYIVKEGPRLVKEGLKIAPNMSVKDSQAVFEAARTMRLQANGSYVQTAADVPPEINAMAEKLRRLDDKVWFHVNGYKAEVGPILRQFGLNDTPGMVLRIKEIQDSTLAGAPIPAFQNEQDAAYATLGLIRTTDTHNLTYAYPNSFYAHVPLVDVAQRLGEEIRELQTQQAMNGGIFGTNPNVPLLNDLQADIDNRAALIKSVTDHIKGRQEPRVKTNPLTGKITGGREIDRYYDLPHKTFGETLAFSRSLEEQPPESVSETANRIVRRGMATRYHNIVLSNAWKALSVLEGPGETPNSREMAKYLRLYTNTVRGVKSALDNERLVRTLQKTVGKIPGVGKYVTEDYVREFAADLMKLRAFQALLLSPRFSIVNSFQTEQTVWPLVGTKIYMRAYMKAVSDFPEYFRLRKLGQDPNWKPSFADAKKLRDNAWVKAQAAGHIGRGERFLGEAEAMAQTRFTKGLDKVVASNWNPFKVSSELTEDFNRVVAKTAGEMVGERGEYEKFRKHIGLLKTYVEPKQLGETPSRSFINARKRALGDAIVDTSQFILDKEGKPTGFTGGLFKQNISQFRTFGVAYTEMWKDTFLHMLKNREAAPFLRMTLSQFMLSGPKAIPGWRVLAAYALTKGVDLPHTSGVGLGWNAMSNNSAPPVNLDMTESFNALPNLPDPTIASIVENAAGATFGPILEVGEKGFTTGWTSPQTSRTILRAALGSAFPMVEASVELAKGGQIKLGGDSKHPHIVQLRTQDMLARLANTATTAKASYYESRERIANAIAGDRPDIVEQEVAKAWDLGIPFTGRDLHQIAGSIKGKKTRMMRMSEVELSDYVLGPR